MTGREVVRLGWCDRVTNWNRSTVQVFTLCRLAVWRKRELYCNFEGHIARSLVRMWMGDKITPSWKVVLGMHRQGGRIPPQVQLVVSEERQYGGGDVITSASTAGRTRRLMGPNSLLLVKALTTWLGFTYTLSSTRYRWGYG